MNVDKFSNVFRPFQEEMKDYFEWEEECRHERAKKAGKPAELQRRPTTGLQLHTENHQLVCLRPGWKPPPSRRLRGENDFGQVLLDVTEIEMFTDGRSDISLQLYKERTALQSWPTEEQECEACLMAIAEVCDKFLRARNWEAFARSSQVDGKCVRCRKMLEVDDSLKHGVGPECIKVMSRFIDVVSDTRKAYVQKYRSMTDVWEPSW